jgi:hypothetical protein
MPLLESGYRAAAKTELERNIRELEAKDRAAQTRTEFQSSASAVQSNITFAQRLNLISQEQADAMEKRVEAATLFERTMRNESQERVDDIENPRERAGRYFDMENVNAEISRERARAESTRTNESSQTREAVHSIPSSEDKSR